MADLRIRLTRRWPQPVERVLAERFNVMFNPEDVPLSRDDLAQAMAEYDVLCPTVTDRIDAEVIAGGERVKLIANYGVGFEHVDLDAAREAGIAVTNTPNVLTEATADLALTLMLMAARRTGEGERMVRAGAWRGWGPTDLVGSAVSGKVLGIVGFGRIGQALARRAHHGLGMRILYHARHPAPVEVARSLDAQFCPDLRELLSLADFVSLHVPGGEATENLIDADALAAMKPGSFLINTARGSVVDHAALAGALKRGKPAGAGLDVYPQEPQVPLDLLDLENLVLLPHLGSAENETRIAMGMRALGNVEAFAAGEPLPDQVA